VAVVYPCSTRTAPKIGFGRGLSTPSRRKSKNKSHTHRVLPPGHPSHYHASRRTATSSSQRSDSGRDSGNDQDEGRWLGNSVSQDIAEMRELDQVMSMEHEDGESNVSHALSDDPMQGKEAMQAEVCPVFDDEDWGHASAADAWCFMCVKRVPQHQLLQNEYYRRLLQLFEQARHLRTVDLCTNIQRFYNDNFAAAHGNQEWTLRSIRAHIYEHLGVSSSFVQDDLVRTLYAQTRLYKESGLRLRDVATGRVHVNFKGMHSYLQCVRMLLHVMKQ
jgi:hypothetical protein